jgi:hypothetical protein
MDQRRGRPSVVTAKTIAYVISDMKGGHYLTSGLLWSPVESAWDGYELDPSIVRFDTLHDAGVAAQLLARAAGGWMRAAAVAVLGTDGANG